MFPRAESKMRVAFLIGSSAGNLPSALRDVHAQYQVWRARGFTCYVFVEQRDCQSTQQKLKDLPPAQLYTTLAPLAALIHQFDQISTDMVLCISSHGYVCANQLVTSTDQESSDSYIVFAGQRYLDDTLHSWLPTKAHMLSLIDTCHSGTMLDLSTAPVSTPRITCISACHDSGSSMDDISTPYGFGGGLSTTFFDYLYDKNLLTQHTDQPLDLADLYLYCTKRIRAQWSQQARKAKLKSSTTFRTDPRSWCCGY